MLSLVVSPDSRTLAVLAPVAFIPPAELGPAAADNMETPIEKWLGLVLIDGSVPLRWVPLPQAARLPLDLLDWSPDGASLALRARATGGEQMARWFVLDAAGGTVRPVAPGLASDASDAGNPHDPEALWRSNGQLLVRAREAGTVDAPDRWWRVAPGSSPEAVPPPARDDGIPMQLGPHAQVIARDDQGIVWREETLKGLFLRAAPHIGGASRTLLALDTHLASVDWGEVRTVDYRSLSGKALKGLVILPPGYDPKRRYPLLVWVYPSTMIDDVHGYWSDPYMPGIYNLQLYAAKGYAVLVPSMPIAHGAGAGGPYPKLTDGVLPAIDALVSLGIADPKRVGVFGQSWGGYATYGLVTGTDRFAAAAAIAGTTDYVTMHGSFDADAGGWPGIAMDQSVNAVIAETAHGLEKPAFDDPALYAANSPITYVRNVRTPLLMAHGTLDDRSQAIEAETFFTELYRQGKPARLLRYNGESHGIALSPANVRNLFDEITAWFDHYLKGAR
jgi:dienelactone hydrolase